MAKAENRKNEKKCINTFYNVEIFFSPISTYIWNFKSANIFGRNYTWCIWIIKILMVKFGPFWFHKSDIVARRNVNHQCQKWQSHLNDQTVENVTFFNLFLSSAQAPARIRLIEMYQPTPRLWMQNIPNITKIPSILHSSKGVGYVCQQVTLCDSLCLKIDPFEYIHENIYHVGIMNVLECIKGCIVIHHIISVMYTANALLKMHLEMLGKLYEWLHCLITSIIEKYTCIIKMRHRQTQ